MKKYLLNLTALIVLLITTTVFASNEHYAIIVDAGSTGSKLHLYQYSNDNHQTKIKEIFTEKTKPGLSYYIDKPENAPASLSKLLDDARAQLKAQNISEKTVPISVLATAGMRKFSEEQQQTIYSNIKHFLQTKYDFVVRDVKTISGKMEGFYGWLDVNYMEDNFAPGKSTIGAVDMGGASTEISFETHDTSRPDDEVIFEYNNQAYIVFSKSFLGLGQDDARFAMLQIAQDPVCYPAGYVHKENGKNYYDFKDCSAAYNKVIAHYQVPSQLIPFKDMKFILFSGVAYAYNFFGVEDASQGALEARMGAICSMSWDDMKKEYADSNVPEDILSAYCANGVYLDNLLYNTYHLSSNQMWVTNKIQGREIDWALGALLYQANSHE